MTNTSAEPAVRLDNISRVFGNTAAVSGLSLDIARGEVVSLVGHSGCGKSTLLRIISGVEKVDAGRVTIDSRCVDGQGFVEPEHRSVGLVFQDYALFPHLSARDNILFGLKSHRREDAAKAAEEIIGLVGIGHLADRFPHTLSGGEQQRVALARALARKPAVLLMDEPFSNLDQGLRERVRSDTLSLLRALGTTVVMVTHDPEEALSSGDRVVLMRSGEIVQSASPRRIYDQPENSYAAEFFCRATKLEGICRQGQVETVMGRFPHPSASHADGPCSVHIRPQAVRVSVDHGDMPARILQRTFRGDREQLLLQVDVLDAPLMVEISEALADECRSVRVSIEAEKLLFF